MKITEAGGVRNQSSARILLNTSCRICWRSSAGRRRSGEVVEGEDRRKVVECEWWKIVPPLFKEKVGVEAMSRRPMRRSAQSDIGRETDVDILRWVVG